MGGLDIPLIIAMTAAATTNAAANYVVSSPAPGITTGRILVLKWLHLYFVCGFSTNM